MTDPKLEIVIGDPILIMPERVILKKDVTLKKEPTMPPTSNPDPKAVEKLTAIARVLGVDPSDENAVRAAFEKLLAPIAAERTTARANLSQRERTMLSNKRLDVVAYTKTRDAIRARSGSRRL